MLTAFTQAMDDVFLVAVPFMAVALVIAVSMTRAPAGRPASNPLRRSPSRLRATPLAP